MLGQEAHTHSCVHEWYMRAMPKIQKSVVTVPPPVNAGRETKKRAEARQHLADVLFDEHGNRRLPSGKELIEAMGECDRRDIWWVCEANSKAPLYLLPTKEWVRALCRFLDDTGAQTVLDAAAGDGFLAKCITEARPTLKVHAVDSGAWAKPQARMNAKDKKEFRGIAFAGLQCGANVVRMDAAAAVKKFKPDVTLVSWAPPGLLVEKVIKAPSSLVVEISVEGEVCGNGVMTWRFNKEFLTGPVEDLALCRMDARPHVARESRITVYFGKRHPEFSEDKWMMPQLKEMREAG